MEGWWRWYQAIGHMVKPNKEKSLNKHTHSSRRMNARGSLRGLKLNVNPEVSTLFTGIRILLRKWALHYERSHTQIAFGKKKNKNKIWFSHSLSAPLPGRHPSYFPENSTVRRDNTSASLKLPQLLPGSPCLVRNFSPVSSARSGWHVTSGVDRGAAGKRWWNGEITFEVCPC